MHTISHGRGRRPRSGQATRPNSLMRGIGYLNYYRKLFFLLTPACSYQPFSAPCVSLVNQKQVSR